MSSTGIEWTDTTWNPVVGCTPVSPGCLNCYAATMARRLEAMGKPGYVGLTVKRKGSARAAGPEDATPATAVGKVSRDVFNGTVRCLPEKLGDPLGWRKPRRVFVNSMSDLFHEDVSSEFIDRVFAIMAMTPRHTFQVLTKRPHVMAAYIADRQRMEKVAARVLSEGGDAAHETLEESNGARLRLKAWPLPNVWLGTSCEDQARADERIPHLLKCPAAVRFLSCEPLLGAIDLKLGKPGDLRCRQPYIRWVIVGGESGAKARPCDVGWIRSIVGQCSAARVACFVKQDSGAKPGTQGRIPDECWKKELPDAKS